MRPEEYDLESDETAWCPGCGNFGIRKILKQALAELEISPRDLVMVSGIGQAAKIPQYFKCNYFNGLHGRSLPAATAIKIANPGLTVIAESGDGCMYGEGGNHFLHAVRRGVDIAHIVHNNMVYGLTKGQASPTSQVGFRTPVQVKGVVQEPFNPLAVAISLGATFVARAYCRHVDQTKEMIKRAVLHKGYALVDIFQPCVSFNKVNTYQWFEDNTTYLEDGYASDSRESAFARAIGGGKLLLGIFYEREIEESFEHKVRSGGSMTPLYEHAVDGDTLQALMESMRY